MNFAFQIIAALWQSHKAVFTGNKPPAGSKTITFNVDTVIVWAALRFGLDVPPEVVDAIATGLLALGNLALRKITTGPMLGDPK